MKKKQNFFTKDHFIRTISSFLLSLSFFCQKKSLIPVWILILRICQTTATERPKIFIFPSQ